MHRNWWRTAGFWPQRCGAQLAIRFAALCTGFAASSRQAVCNEHGAEAGEGDHDEPFPGHPKAVGESVPDNQPELAQDERLRGASDQDWNDRHPEQQGGKIPLEYDGQQDESMSQRSAMISTQQVASKDCAIRWRTRWRQNEIRTLLPVQCLPLKATGGAHFNRDRVRDRVKYSCRIWMLSDSRATGKPRGELTPKACAIAEGGEA